MAIKKIKPGELFRLGNNVFTYSINEKGAVLIAPAPNAPPIKEPLKKDFIPPTLQEVKDFYKGRGYSELAAENAFDYYSNGNPPWTDRNGDKVISWKQKMIANWMKPSDKISVQEDNGSKKMIM